jgi:hypothetical protein
MFVLMYEPGYRAQRTDFVVQKTGRVASGTAGAGVAVLGARLVSGIGGIPVKQVVSAQTVANDPGCLKTFSHGQDPSRKWRVHRSNLLDHLVGGGQ